MELFLSRIVVKPVFPDQTGPFVPHASPPDNSPAIALAARRDRPAWEIAGVPWHGSLPEAEAFCRSLASRHYENFTVATRLVPPRLRQHLANVYAFARWSDDLADESPSPTEALAALGAWRKRLERCFAGRPDHPIFIALAETIRQARLTIEPFSDLLDAFEQDQSVTRYRDRPALLDYCRRSADPVGRIVLALEGCRDPERVALSDSICTGLQLVNFWQDVKRDRVAGRVYLPADDMHRHGVDEAMLDANRAPPPLVDLLRAEVAWARECLDRGLPLEQIAPPVLRPAVGMFVRGGLAIADAIERIGCDTLAQRPTLSRWTKLRLAGRAWWGTLTTGSRKPA
jgi:squalene synthase HpnC